MTHPMDSLLHDMWMDYTRLNPVALKIYSSLNTQGEKVLNDHIALRTFRHPRWGIESLAWAFLKYGYREKKDYHFTEKKLYAKHYEPPTHRPEWPLIFISELLLEQTSKFLRETIESTLQQVPEEFTQNEKQSVSGRPWRASYKVYQELALESEYASWLYAHGFRPNHFTVNVNQLKRFKNLPELNQFLVSQGHTLNSSGGLIKGSPEVLLEQSSTMAENIPTPFTEGVYEIPGCYYEFAKRYPLPDGQLYKGFVAASADKIFESTNTRTKAPA